MSDVVVYVGLPDVLQDATATATAAAAAGGAVRVVAAPIARHVSAAARAVAAAVTEYLRTGSKLPVWDRRVGSGFWRSLVVREGRQATWLPCPTNKSAASEVPSLHDLDPMQWLVRFTVSGTHRGAAALFLADTMIDCKLRDDE